MERVVNMQTLEDTFILKVFKERTWTKLLNPSGNVFGEIIREFFANALVEGECINCWVRQREFFITMESIQYVLEWKHQLGEAKLCLQPTTKLSCGEETST